MKWQQRTEPRRKLSEIQIPVLPAVDEKSWKSSCEKKEINKVGNKLKYSFILPFSLNPQKHVSHPSN